MAQDQNSIRPGERLVGDLNGDGRIGGYENYKDLSYYIYEGIPLTPEQYRISDINGDGIVDKEDLRMVQNNRDNWFARWIPVDSPNPRIYYNMIDPSTGQRGEPLSWADYRGPAPIMNSDGTFYVEGEPNKPMTQKIISGGIISEIPYTNEEGYRDIAPGDNVDYSGDIPAIKDQIIDSSPMDIINIPMELPFYPTDPLPPDFINDDPINPPVEYPDPINPPVEYPDPINPPIVYPVNDDPINPPIVYPVNDDPINPPIVYPVNGDPINSPVTPVTTADFSNKINELLKNPLVLIGGGILLLMILSRK